MRFRFDPLRTQSNEMLRLDFLRFVAACGVMWHHSHEFLFPPAVRAQAVSHTFGQVMLVDLFFVISGFVIATVYSDRINSLGDFSRFMQRRIGRLVPLHWLTFIVAAALWTMVKRAGFAADHAPDMSVACMVKTFFLLQSLSPCTGGPSLNGVTWSISTEMMLYLSFPLTLLVARSRAVLTAVFAVTLGYLLVLHAHGVSWHQLPFIGRGVPMFVFGVFLYSVRDSLRPLRLGSWPMLAAMFAMLAAMMIGADERLILALILLTATLGVAADMHAPPGRGLTLLAPLGQLTYSIYMWHSLIVIVLLNALADKLLKLSTLPMIGAMVATYAVIFAVSYLSWTLIETPARRWVDRLPLVPKKRAVH
ncbi:acyltransferase [uncultured Sphingomonas sp.]|uniref:acyltransferase family protein n=1 Tax=uncultured Sphingomonas sp. TaxID=158754 RepID=UPI0025D6077A|nr:acyltransferase [uncultured Sphingomonas sp.]